MNLAELNDLDFENVGSWPPAAQAFAVVVLFVLTLGAGYWFVLDDQWVGLEAATASEEDLKTRYRIKYIQTGAVPNLKKQLEEGETTFSEMLAQLPKSVNVAELLTDISSAGLKEGLAFESIIPQDEEDTDFYSLLPIRIILRGEYHQFGRFVSRLAALQRIVTLSDIKIKPDGSESNILIMEATAKTYWSKAKGAK